MKDENCLDCKVNTFEINEYYVVHNSIWNTVNAKIKGMLCIGCLETRLGRRLTHKDFTPAPINYSGIVNIHSARLKNRLSGRQFSVRALKRIIHNMECNVIELWDEVDKLQRQKKTSGKGTARYHELCRIENDAKALLRTEIEAERVRQLRRAENDRKLLQ